MILLDTNVLSEFMRPNPDRAVATWLDAQFVEQVFVSAITRAEIYLGIALLPSGQRQAGLQVAANTVFNQDFAGRCLAFDEVAADCYAIIVATRRHAGRPITVEDAQIAAIALAHGMILATRNIRDFTGIDGLLMVNPWDEMG